jgi:hypothetical protein
MTINYGVLLGFVPSDDTEVGKYTEAVFLQALGYCIFFFCGVRYSNFNYLVHIYPISLFAKTTTCRKCGLLAN